MRKIEKRIILLNVIDEYVSGDGVSVGAQGSHDDVILRISFSESWEGTTKRVEWINAVGESVGVTLITPLMLHKDNVYNVPVPAGVKEHGGEITVTVQGVVIDEETSLETVKIRTEEAHFRVLKSFSGITEVDDVIPSQAEQLQAEIDAFSKEIVNLSTAVDDARRSADRAESYLIYAGETISEIEEIEKEVVQTAEQIQKDKEEIDNLFGENKSYVNKTFANAVALNRTGRAVTLGNCSPIDANINIKLKNKNLIPFPYETPFSVLEDAGLTVTDNGDGSFVLNGTATKFVNFIFTSHLKLETYTNYYLTSVADMSRFDGMGTILLSDAEEYTTFGVEGDVYFEDASDFKIWLEIYTGDVFDNLLYTPQIELGNKQTDFTPYCKAEDMTVSAKGKNLVSFEPHTENDNGLDVIYGEDGIITLIGIKNSDEMDYEGKPFTPSVVFDVPLDPEKTYYARIDTYNQDNIVFGTIDDYEMELYENAGFTRQINGQDKVRLTVKPQSYYTYNESHNMKFKLQVELGGKTAFEKGVETQLILNADGTVENADAIDLSVAPTITAYPEGAVMDISYNADTKKYIDEKIAEISAQIV